MGIVVVEVAVEVAAAVVAPGVGRELQVASLMVSLTPAICSSSLSLRGVVIKVSKGTTKETREEEDKREEEGTDGPFRFAFLVQSCSCVFSFFLSFFSQKAGKGSSEGRAERRRKTEDEEETRSGGVFWCWLWLVVSRQQTR